MLENGFTPELDANTTLEAVMVKNPNLGYPAGAYVKKPLKRKRTV